MTYYEILQVSENASSEVIRMAYKALAKKYHPDVFEGDQNYAEEQMKLINEAYDVLSDEERRKEYDRTIFRKSSAKNESKATDEHISHDNVKLPKYLTWWFIGLMYCVFYFFPIVPIFLNIKRLLFNKKHSQYNNKGGRKLILTFIAFICVLSIAIIASENAKEKNYDTIKSVIAEKDFVKAKDLLDEKFPDVNNYQSRELWYEYYCGIEEYDRAAEIYINVIENSADILRCKNHFDKLEEIKSLISEENKEKLLELRKEYKKAEKESINQTTTKTMVEKTTQNETTKSDNKGNATTTTEKAIIIEQQTEDKESATIKVVADINSYSKLKKYEIEDVYGIYDGKILMKTFNNNEYLFVDINSGKVVETFTGTIHEDAFENGFIYYFDYETSKQVIKRFNGKAVIVPDDEYRIVEELFEEEIFIVSRQRNDYEFSGYELAAISFDGKMVTDWIAAPIEGSIIDVLCRDLGEGIVYLGEDNYLTFQDEEGISYFLDVYTGKILEWPKNAPRFDRIIRETSDSEIGSLSKFKDGYCVGYRSYFGGFSSTVTEYFKFDFENGYRTLFKIYGDQASFFESESRKFYQYGYLGDWSESVEWSIYDMYGNKIPNTSNYEIESYEVFDDSFGLIVKSKNGNENERFFTIINYEGKELFSPINCTDASVYQFDEEEIFCLVDGEIAEFYNYKGKKIGETSEISVKEKGLVTNRKQNYKPIYIDIIDGYIIGGYVSENGDKRCFIGTLEYVNR